MSPEPVTSIETVSLLFFNLIETWALGSVNPSWVFHVRPRQSNAIVSGSPSNSIPLRQRDRSGVQIAVAIEVHRYGVAGFVFVDSDGGSFARIVCVAANRKDCEPSQCTRRIHGPHPRDERWPERG